MSGPEWKRAGFDYRSTRSGSIRRLIAMGHSQCFTWNVFSPLSHSGRGNTRRATPGWPTRRTNCRGVSTWNNRGLMSGQFFWLIQTRQCSTWNILCGAIDCGATDQTPIEDGALGKAMRGSVCSSVSRGTPSTGPAEASRRGQVFLAPTRIRRRRELGTGIGSCHSQFRFLRISGTSFALIQRTTCLAASESE